MKDSRFPINHQFFIIFFIFLPWSLGCWPRVLGFGEKKDKKEELCVSKTGAHQQVIRSWWILLVVRSVFVSQQCARNFVFWTCKLGLVILKGFFCLLCTYNCYCYLSWLSLCLFFQFHLPPQCYPCIVSICDVPLFSLFLFYFCSLCIVCLVFSFSFPQFCFPIKLFPVVFYLPFYAYLLSESPSAIYPVHSYVSLPPVILRVFSSDS